MSYIFYSFYVDVSDISQQLIFGIFGQFTKTKQHETSDNIYRVRIIGSHFANYKVNSIYCKVVNQKLWSRFFPKEILICPNHIFPHYILISFIHCMLLSKEILLISKTTPQNAKTASQFSKKTIFSCGKVKASLPQHIFCEVNFKQ